MKFRPTRRYPLNKMVFKLPCVTKIKFLFFLANKSNSVYPFVIPTYTKTEFKPWFKHRYNPFKSVLVDNVTCISIRSHCCLLNKMSVLFKTHNEIILTIMICIENLFFSFFLNFVGTNKSHQKRFMSIRTFARTWDCSINQWTFFLYYSSGFHVLI